MSEIYEVRKFDKRGFPTDNAKGQVLSAEFNSCKGFLIIHMSTFQNNSLFFKNKNILSKKVGKKWKKWISGFFFKKSGRKVKSGKKWKKWKKWTT